MTDPWEDRRLLRAGSLGEPYGTADDRRFNAELLDELDEDLELEMEDFREGKPLSYPGETPRKRRTDELYSTSPPLPPPAHSSGHSHGLKGARPRAPEAVQVARRRSKSPPRARSTSPIQSDPKELRRAYLAACGRSGPVDTQDWPTSAAAPESARRLFTPPPADHMQRHPYYKKFANSSPTPGGGGPSSSKTAQYYRRPMPPKPKGPPPPGTQGARRQQGDLSEGGPDPSTPPPPPPRPGKGFAGSPSGVGAVHGAAIYGPPKSAAPTGPSPRDPRDDPTFAQEYEAALGRKCIVPEPTPEADTAKALREPAEMAPDRSGARTPEMKEARMPADALQDPEFRAAYEQACGRRSPPPETHKALPRTGFLGGTNPNGGYATYPLRPGQPIPGVIPPKETPPPTVAPRPHPETPPSTSHYPHIDAMTGPPPPPLGAGSPLAGPASNHRDPALQAILRVCLEEGLDDTKKVQWIKDYINTLQ